MRLSALRPGGERAVFGDLDPIDDSGNRIEIPYFVYVLQRARSNGLFDTCIDYELVRALRGRLGPVSDLFDFAIRDGDAADSQLARIGVALGDAEHIFVSRQRYETAGGIASFPTAMVWALSDGLAFAFADAWPEGLYMRADFNGDVRWREIHGEHDQSGDGRGVCIPRLGHSARFQSLIVRLETRTVARLRPDIASFNCADHLRMARDGNTVSTGELSEKAVALAGLLNRLATTGKKARNLSGLRGYGRAALGNSSAAHCTLPRR